MSVLAIDHIQISIPKGRLAEALPFYTQVLGFRQVPKPAEVGDEGAWLEQGSVRIHLGEESPFSTDGCAHPALRVDDLDSILQRATDAGRASRRDPGPSGYRRASVFDAFGNRIELMQKITSEITDEESR
jgi:catechol 2,3-dioxygenase-like lactoylglutathione lyase family enzyme